MSVIGEHELAFVHDPFAAVQSAAIQHVFDRPIHNHAHSLGRAAAERAFQGQVIEVLPDLGRKRHRQGGGLEVVRRAGHRLKPNNNPIIIRAWPDGQVWIPFFGVFMPLKPRFLLRLVKQLASNDGNRPLATFLAALFQP